MSIFIKPITDFIVNRIGNNGLQYIVIGLSVLLMALLVVPNLDQIKERLGFESRTSLKVDLAKKDAVIDETTSANETLVKAVEIETKTLEISDKVMSDLNATKEQNTKVAKAVVSKKKTVYRQAAKQKKPLSQEDKSLVQIRSIWESYCAVSYKCQIGVTQ